MYEIFRKNLGLMIAPANENNTSRGRSVHQRLDSSYVQMSRRDLLLVKKLEWTMNWIISSTEGGEKPDGTREGKGRDCDQFD